MSQEPIKIQMKKLSELKPYEKNPRKNEAAVEYVANSIHEFGFKVPLVVDSAGVIVAGHTRYKAAEKLGLEEVPCIIADDLTDEQIKAFRLADNKTAEFSEWNDGLLGVELAGITGLDMEQFGFELMSDMDDDEAAKEVEPEVPFTEELLEENNFVVLFFDNSIDWLQAQSVLGISQVRALDSKPGFPRMGLGRVINGTKFIERLTRDEH